MPRARSPNRELARQLWVESGGKRKLTDIAAQIGVSPEQVRKWKSADAWEKTALPKRKGNVTNSTLTRKGNVTDSAPKRKRGGQPQNRNAVGNSGGAAPKGNVNALKHGGYSSVYWDTLTDEERALITDNQPDPETLLREEIALLSVRERRIMARIRKISEFDEQMPNGMGQVVAGVIKNEDKRKFDSQAEKDLYETLRRAEVESGKRLPGRKYSVTTRTEATYDVIHRLEDALTRCQGQKQKLIRNLMELRRSATDGGEVSDAVRLEVETAIRRRCYDGTGGGDSVPDESSD